MNEYDWINLFVKGVEDGGGWLIGKGVYSADLDFCCLSLSK